MWNFRRSCTVIIIENDEEKEIKKTAHSAINVRSREAFLKRSLRWIRAIIGCND